MKKLEIYRKIVLILMSCVISSCTLEDLDFEYHKCNNLNEISLFGNFEANYKNPIKINENDEDVYKKYQDGFCPKEYIGCFEVPEKKGVYACSLCEKPWMLKCKNGDDNICIDVKSNPNNCGECGRKCNNGHCDNGECFCDLSEADCLAENKLFNQVKCECIEKAPVSCGNGEIYHFETEACICDKETHWVGESGDCRCDIENNYIELNEKCVLKHICNNIKEIYVDSSNTCACDIDRHWTGLPGNCGCDGANNYIELNDECVEKKECDLTRETYNKADNSCVCNAEKHRKNVDGICVCDEDANFVELNEICVTKAACDTVKEDYNPTNNTCGCKTAAHWVGSAGSCMCDTANDYVENQGVCVGTAKCDSDKETYIKADNSCICDINKYRVGTPGNCVCDSANGYIELNGACVKKAVCDEPKENYNGSNNTCSCNTDKHWTGSVGNCTCKFGYKQNGTSCVAIDFSIGKKFEFGHYEQDGITSNGKEPIVWRVLSKIGSSVFVVSEKALDTKKYNESRRDVTWGTSTIRSWLNGYGSSDNSDKIDYSSNSFKIAAFTNDEWNRIQITNVTAEKNPSYPNVNAGSQTTDKIFLLSIGEANTYFASTQDRLLAATSYAIKNGAYTQTIDGKASCASWWLRTPGFAANIAATGDYNGSVYNVGNGVDTLVVTVRPAFWLNIE